MEKTSKKTAIDNGAAGLRGFADILTFLAIFGFCGAVICIIIELIDWRGFGIFTACCIAAIITRFVLSALATIAEAAARYLEESREKIREA